MKRWERKRHTKAYVEPCLEEALPVSVADMLSMFGSSPRAFAASLLVTLGLVSGCSFEVEGRLGGDPESAREPAPTESAEPIVNGLPATSYPEAVVIDAVRWGKPWRCTGALVAPKVVLTAGHCVLGVTSAVVKAPYAGKQQAKGAKFLSYDWKDTSGYVVAEQHDVGLVVLDAPIALASYPALAKERAADGALAVSVGRIHNGSANAGLYVSQPLALEDGGPKGWAFYYLSKEVIQSGDSGGPVVLVGPGPHTIVAVNSAGGNGTQFLARTDLLRDWIDQTIAAATVKPAACAHAVCSEGSALVPACDPCVAAICAADAYCCKTAWDHVCVDEVTGVCGKGC